ncbi:MAG: LCP family protein [Aristaeellaceae bacterium]
MKRHRILSALLALLCLLGVRGGRAESVWGDLDSRLNAGSVEYDGTTYRPKKRLTTILLLGIDQWEDEARTGTFRSGSQADFQLLVVFDENARTVSEIHINRDLMAEVTVLSLLGEEIGTRTAQLCTAYGYGDGEAQSCQLAVACVSRRFMNIPIDHYCAMKLDGIQALNDALGGVEVTLEEDFTAYDPAMTPGATLRLTGMQAEYFLRYRYNVGDGSNAARLGRQYRYMESAKDILQARLEESTSSIEAILDAVEPYIITDMSRGRLVNLANLARRYTVQPVTELEGDNIVGDSGLYEFYPDEDQLTRLLLEIFYDPIVK